MKIFIVIHEHESDNCGFSTNVVSAHILRENAEKSVKREKEECLKEYWEGYEKDASIEVEHDFSGLFEIYDSFNGNRDSIYIHEETIVD